MTFGKMNRMPKVKISISVNSTVVAAVDRLAESEGETRSSIIERWLQDASRRNRSMSLEADTAAYYEALSDEEREENAAWAVASSGAFRRLDGNRRRNRTVNHRSQRRRGA